MTAEIDCGDVGSCRLVARVSIFTSERVDRTVKAGAKLAEMVADAVPDDEMRRFAFVELAGADPTHQPVPVPRALWHRVRPKPGTTIQVLLVPMGGGGGGKNPLRVILSIAIIGASFFLGPTVGGGILAGIYGGAANVPATILGVASGTFGAALGGFLIPLAGPMLISAAPPQQGGRVA